MTKGEKEVIGELFYGYDKDKDRDIQHRRLEAIQIYQLAVKGEYDKCYTDKREKGGSVYDIDENKIPLEKRELLNTVRSYLTRAFRDGESFWISYVDYHIRKNLSDSDLCFILSIIGKDITSFKYLLEEKTYYRIFN